MKDKTLLKIIFWGLNCFMVYALFAIWTGRHTFSVEQMIKLLIMWMMVSIFSDIYDAIEKEFMKKWEKAKG